MTTTQSTQTTAGTPTVEIAGLSRAFGETTVLDGLDLSINPGEFVALLGRSGSGKSTLLRAVAGLDHEAQGRIVVDGEVSVAFQQPRLLPWRRVWQNVVLGLPRGEATRERALRALAEVELTDLADRWPSTLSGGQAGRVSLARALVREPALLLLDEPFGALDALTRLTMHSLVEELFARHRPAILLVTHDVDEALRLADRVLVLDGGVIVSDRRIETPRPRRREDHTHLHSLVLDDLGVHDQ